MKIRYDNGAQVGSWWDKSSGLAASYWQFPIICLSDQPLIPLLGLRHPRNDSRFAPSQWETALLCNAVSHWLGANLESVLHPLSEDQRLCYGGWRQRDQVWRCGRLLMIWLPHIGMDWICYLGYVSRSWNELLFWTRVRIMDCWLSELLRVGWTYHLVSVCSTSGDDLAVSDWLKLEMLT